MVKDYYWALKLEVLKYLSTLLQYYGQKLCVYSMRIHFYVNDIENPRPYKYYPEVDSWLTNNTGLKKSVIKNSANRTKRVSKRRIR